ncbi:hypothetical protein BC831DRAFT_453706 [Entophlyctis helioformis]|nr:hypothetical protein BC831DRAFT_453706 [Entophlyctis helioformis]
MVASPQVRTSLNLLQAIQQVADAQSQRQKQQSTHLDSQLVDDARRIHQTLSQQTQLGDAAAQSIGSLVDRMIGSTAVCHPQLSAALFDWISTNQSTISHANGSDDTRSRQLQTLVRNLLVVPNRTALSVSLASGHSIAEFCSDFAEECEALAALSFERLHSVQIPLSDPQLSAAYDETALAFGALADTIAI